MKRDGLSPAVLALCIAIPVLAAPLALGLGPAAVAVGLAVPVMLAGGAALVAWPFLGLVTIVLVAQTDALFEHLVGGLPLVKLLTATTLGAALLRAARRPPGPGLRTDPSIALAITFGMAMLLSAQFAADGAQAAEGVRRMLSVIALFLLVALLVDTERKVLLVLLAILASSAISAAVVVLDARGVGGLGAAAAMGEAGGEAVRSRGATSGDPTTAASILLAGSGVALVLMLKARDWLRPVAAVSFLVIVAGIVFSLTRSATLLVGLGVAWQIWLRRRNPAVVFLGLLGVLAAIPLAPDDLAQRMSALFGGSHDFTLLRRIGYNIIGLDLFSQHPLFGIGPDNFERYYTAFDYRWVPGRTPEPRVLHNMYLAVAVETGIVGAIPFLGMLAFGLARCRRAVRSTSSALLAIYGEATLFGFALFLIVSMTLPNETNKYIWIFAGLTAAIARIHERAQPQRPGDVPRGSLP